MTGRSSEDWRKFLQMAWSHILRKANSTILNGDSVRASLLLGLRATVEKLLTIFSRACQEIRCTSDNQIRLNQLYHPILVEKKAHGGL
jgi:hypothetical protein